VEYSDENHPTEPTKAYNRGLRRAIYRVLLLLAVVAGVAARLLFLRNEYLSTEAGRAAYNGALWHLGIAVVVFSVAVWLIIFTPLARNMKNEAIPRWGKRTKKPKKTKSPADFNVPTDS